MTASETSTAATAATAATETAPTVWSISARNPTDNTSMTLSNFPATDIADAVLQFVKKFPGFLIHGINGFIRDRNGNLQTMDYYYQYEQYDGNDPQREDY